MFLWLLVGLVAWSSFCDIVGGGEHFVEGVSSIHLFLNYVFLADHVFDGDVKKMSAYFIVATNAGTNLEEFPVVFGLSHKQETDAIHVF